MTNRGAAGGEARQSCEGRANVALVAEGRSTDDILGDYPDLEAGDVREALLFAAEAVRERMLPLAAGE